MPQHEFEKLILDPRYKKLLVLVKAVRNGLVYGAKVRFPHALVMVFLFRPGTIQEKIRMVYKATRQHALNLAKFAFLYKASMLVLGNMNGGKEEASHSFIAGLFGGYLVFGAGKHSFNSVNQQIVIYIFARVVLGAAKLTVTPQGNNSLVGGQYGGKGGRNLLGLNEMQIARLRENSWPVFASVSWASVMWLFRWYPEMLQPSLRSSMQYMYVSLISLPFIRNYRNLENLPLTKVCRCSDIITRTIGIPRETSYGTTGDMITISLGGNLRYQAIHCSYPFTLPPIMTCWSVISGIELTMLLAASPIQIIGRTCVLSFFNTHSPAYQAFQTIENRQIWQSI